MCLTACLNASQSQWAGFLLSRFAKAARPIILSPAITDFIEQQRINCIAH